MALRPTTLTLYHRPFSNCSARVRIAARLKGVELILKNATPYFQNGSLEDKDAQRFHIEINPNGKVPALVADYANGQRQTLTQSLTILQLLEETYPNTTRLIPPVTDMSARLKVQDLALTIACDIQPLPTARVCSTLSYMGFDPKVLTPEQWARQRIIYGMKKYEAMVKHSVGKYSVGDELSIADVCLVPMLQSARRLGYLPARQGYEHIASE